MSVKIGTYTPPPKFALGDVVLSVHPYDVKHTASNVGTVVHVFPDDRYNVRFDDLDTGISVRTRTYVMLRPFKGGVIETWLEGSVGKAV